MVTRQLSKNSQGKLYNDRNEQEEFSYQNLAASTYKNKNIYTEQSNK